MPQKPPTRQLILEAVINSIEKYGLEQVTTRRIAEAAGTNIASINYHFRSKDELVTQALSLTIKNMLQDVMDMIGDNQPFEEMLREVFRDLVEGGARWPGISRAHFTPAVLTGRRDTVGVRAIVKVFSGLSARAAAAYPRKDRQLLRLRLSQVMSAILFGMVMPDLFGVHPRSRAARRRYADSFTTLFLESI